MAAQIILLFGDQADAPIPILRPVLAKSRHSKNLQTFLQSAIDVVQLEVVKLTTAERETLGSFHSVQDLVQCLANKKDRFGIAQMVLVFIARIGELILHVENSPSLLATGENSPQLLTLGICGGLLAAAAASVARNVAELIEVASLLAGVTCRVAVEISRRAIQIEDDDTGSWAFSALGAVVPELPSILDQFHKDQSIPPHRQAYVAVNADTWATVFGPPSVLKTLLETSTPLQQSDITRMAAFGAVHAGHLALPDLDEIIGQLENAILNKSIKPNCKFMPGSRYIPLAPSNLRDLLQEILQDIFQRGTNPARLFDAAGSFLRKRKEISLYMLGNTGYLLLLRKALQTQGFKVAVLTSAPSPQTSQIRGGSGSVAIVEFHRKIPADRFDVDSYLDETGRSKNAITSPYASFLDRPGLFDHKMFNVSPREAVLMDPGQRLVMHATYEALENAGFATNGTLATDNKRVRTFIGTGGDDWRELQQPLGVDKYIIQGTQRAFTPGRLHHHFKWEGATFAVDSACGSTATAVGLAYTALMNRDCDTAIAGGSNIIATPYWQSALSKGGFLSPTGGCKTFRADADGYCRGEAIGVMVLKRLEDALQDNDNIVSVIRGYARNHSAETVSITRPHSQTQERLYRNVLNKAGLEPHQVGYVEMHGTGTIAGDSAELESVANVFAQKGSRENPLVVGAIKANIGHSEAASGICSLIKAAMTFKKEVVPPQVGIPENLRHRDLLNQSSILVPGKPVSFSRQTVGQQRNIVVNNFDAAGGNSCFVLQEPPLSPRKELDPRGYHVITCSAHCAVSFERNKRRLLEFLTQNSDTNLANLAYTTTSRRMHHSLKSAYSGSSIQNIIDGLNKDLKGGNNGASHPNSKSPIVFVFTGQGAHYSGMGGDFYRTSPQFRGTITNLQKVCETFAFPSFVELIADPNSSMKATTTVQLHLALSALQLALVDLWRLWGIEPDVVIGHSIGEYAALYAAGVLSANDVMYLIGKRAELIQNKAAAGTHGMLSISGPAEELSAILSKEALGTCEVSCRNGPGMVVVSGEQQDISRLKVLLERQFKCRLLEVPYAMHSCQMDVILREFRQLLQGVRFSSPRINLVSTLLGELVEEGGVFGADYLVRHTREQVKFEEAVSNCVSRGLADSTALWLEVGPSPICLGRVRSCINLPSANALASLKNGDNNWKSASAVLATVFQANKPVRWREYHRDFAACLSLITLPEYAFDTRDFWMTFSDNIQSSAPEKRTESQTISTCLHNLIKQEDSHSAVFTSDMSQPSLLKIIQGHKLSGIASCPAGVFSDMALTVVRYALTNGVSTAPFPSLSVLDMQIDRPITAIPDAKKLIQVGINRQKDSAKSFGVTFTDCAKPSSPMISKCVVRFRDESAFEAEKQKLFSSIQPKITKLMKDARNGFANRIQKKIFYKLFSNLMDYTDPYEGVEDAVVSNDFTEAIATVTIPRHHSGNSDENFTLSPYWIDSLTHLAGFLLNGNPMEPSDDVYIATQIERMEIVAEDFSPNVAYQSYAYITHSEGSKFYSGHAYILREGCVVGTLEGAHFRKMPRKALHSILGKVDPPKAINGRKESPGSSAPPLQTNGHLDIQNSDSTKTTKGQTSSVVAVFISLLLDETGMSESELDPSTFFSEIGVDSLMSISILAGLKAATGLELGASFLMEHPTLEDAQRALRMIENKNKVSSTSTTGAVMTNGHNGVAHEKRKRECNVVLLQGPPSSTSRKPFFMIADGAGSAAAYIHLPKIGEDLPVFAVESPWVQDPENFTASFTEAAVMYLAAIRARQPHGPYLLGGWSAGDVFAYEVARLLLKVGEQVLGLIIIDIPGPRHVDMTRVTPPSMDVIDQIGMLTGIERSFANATPQAQRLKRHMLSTVTCFSKLEPVPMAPGCQPDATFVLWVMKEILPKTSNGASALSGFDAWFYPSSRDGDPNGWDVLVGNKLECSQLQGDHFSIIMPPEVEQLGKLMQDAVSKCTRSSG